LRILDVCFGTGNNTLHLQDRRSKGAPGRHWGAPSQISSWTCHETPTRVQKRRLEVRRPRRNIIPFE
jgi:hypothetical protein